MFEDPRGLVPQIIDRVELPSSATQIPLKPEPLGPEQLQALDANFAQTDEQRAVAGIFAAWTGSILLADLAQEHFHLPPEEPQPRRDEEDDEEDEE